MGAFPLANLQLLKTKQSKFHIGIYKHSRCKFHIRNIRVTVLEFLFNLDILSEGSYPVCWLSVYICVVTAHPDLKTVNHLRFATLVLAPRTLNPLLFKYTVAKPQHPCIVLTSPKPSLLCRAPFNISKALLPSITPGSTYEFESTLAFIDSNTDDNVNMKINLQLQGYGSVATSLIQDKIYFLSGRLIALNAKIPPVFYFEQDLTFPIADSKEEKDDSSATSQFNNLLVKIHHTDYNVQTQNSVRFTVQYKVAGNRNLGKKFGLFQVGREVLISGYIAGYSVEERMLQVNALSMSISTGTVASSGINTANTATLPHKSRWPVQIYFESDTEPDPPLKSPPPKAILKNQQDKSSEDWVPRNSPLPANSNLLETPRKKRKYTKRAQHATQDKESNVLEDMVVEH
ncbi:hypothetical protein PtB15_14B43 [Puccinia triticina]|nr:hypothetical protein PtB15_14B43 [Puccinia triticina]